MAALPLPLLLTLLTLSALLCPPPKHPTPEPLQVFKGADLDAYTCQLSRRVAQQLPGATLASVREHVTSSVVATLHAYRKHCATHSSMMQLILPDALKLLPLHALALLKGPALKVRCVGLAGVLLQL